MIRWSPTELIGFSHNRRIHFPLLNTGFGWLAFSTKHVQFRLVNKLNIQPKNKLNISNTVGFCCTLLCPPRTTIDQVLKVVGPSEDYT